MNRFVEWLKSRMADDASVPVSVVYARFVELSGGEPEVVTTRQASGILGFSTKFWRRMAESGAIEGAWREEGGIWRLPLAECRRHLLKRENQKKEFKPRGPQKKAKGAQAA